LTWRRDYAADIGLRPVSTRFRRIADHWTGKIKRSGTGRQRRGERIVIVLGHPDYYPRFGFSTGKARSLESPFPADAFMAMELSPGAQGGIRGKVKYPAAFGRGR
jgi:hypothetical protein